MTTNHKSGTIEFVKQSAPAPERTLAYRTRDGNRILVGTIQKVATGGFRTNVGGMVSRYPTLLRARNGIARYLGATGTVTVAK